jgi:hypothetical protein
MDYLHAAHLGSDLPKKSDRPKPPAKPAAVTGNPGQRRNAVPRVAAMAFECFQEAIRVTTEATKIAQARRDEDQLLRVNDRVGAGYAAYIATSYVCLLAATHGFNAAIIPPEPRSQRDARSRPDREKWEQAEQKELSTLWKMGTFLHTARPRPFEYDPLPLHFIYKLKVKDGYFDNVTYKARLVM